MNYKMDRFRTPGGKVRHELRVWGYGPNNRSFKRTFNDMKALHLVLDQLRADEFMTPKTEEVQEKVQTFGDLYQDFNIRRVPTFSPGWKLNLKGYWRELETQLSSLSPAAINSDLLKSIEMGLRKKGNSQRTANIKIGFIKAVMNFALEMDKITVNTAAKFKKTKPPDPNVQFWELADAEDFLSFASSKYPRGSENRWKYVVYLLGINAGLRAGEIWALKPRCLKRERGVMHIDQQFDRVSKDFTPPKGKGPRDVPLNETLANELEALIKQGEVGRQELIFRNEVGNPMDHDNFRERIYEQEFSECFTGPEKLKGVRWGGHWIKFHGLRHTAATLMLGSGIDVKTVQEILGHKDLATTMKYLHAISGSVGAAAKVFDIKPSVSKLKLVTLSEE